MAFCIIIGDTIRTTSQILDEGAATDVTTAHVMIYLFPRLREMPFLWLLTDRRAIIVVFVLCISYPLSLYRDIAKVSQWMFAAIIFAEVVPASEGKCAGTCKHAGHSRHRHFPRGNAATGTKG